MVVKSKNPSFLQRVAAFSHFKCNRTKFGYNKREHAAAVKKLEELFKEVFEGEAERALKVSELVVLS